MGILGKKTWEEMRMEQLFKYLIISVWQNFFNLQNSTGPSAYRDLDSILTPFHLLSYLNKGNKKPTKLKKAGVIGIARLMIT